MYLNGFIIALISLGHASYEDIRTRMVSNYNWWIFSAGLLMILFGGRKVFPADIAGCAFAVLVQELIMCRAYGRADSHAFSCCAVFMCLSGSGLEGHILHMSLSLALLTFVQLLRGNIGRNLKLKHPVPFVPYIAVSFLFANITMHSVKL